MSRGAPAAVVTWLATASAALIALLPCAARAQVPPGTGFEAGVRSGYALALGPAPVGESDLSDTVTGAVPLWVDVGYRVLPQLFAGAYGQYGIGVLGDRVSSLCAEPASECSASDLRVGLALQLGPALSFSLDQYLEISAECGGLASRSCGLFPLDGTPDRGFPVADLLRARRVRPVSASAQSDTPRRSALVTPAMPATRA